MKHVHCDGCTYIEAEDVARSKRRIVQEVTIAIVNDPRAPEGTDKYSADLCSACLTLLLHTYFKVRAEGKLELALPTFMNPNEQEVPASASIKAAP